ncbi:MAG: SAM-dependent chlorinase/fluorinase [Verrucomicrobiota bacterium]
MPATVTLTTDLGTQEPSVASIKGVLLSGCRDVSILDLGHQISPHQVTEAALFALSSVPCFPEGTIHLINVAPGPRPIAARVGGQFVICPDNGILTLLGDHYEIESVREIEVPQDIVHRNSQTFYGREVFAPAAAALASGTSFEELGEETAEYEKMDWPQPSGSGGDRIEGRIMHVDRFGNLISNIHSTHLENVEVQRVVAGRCTVYSISGSYDEVPEGKPLSLIGDAGYLELAYHGDKANERLGVEPGIVVEVIGKV